MVFGSKPKKVASIKLEDKRRISLLNSDFKLSSGLYAERFKNTFTHTLSSKQIMAGDDKRIHHMINKARDTIYTVSKSKQGCALVDLDFIAAFDNQVLSWVLAVLKAKGASEKVIDILANLYKDSITIPVVNNSSLRQGYPGACAGLVLQLMSCWCI